MYLRGCHVSAASVREASVNCASNHTTTHTHTVETHYSSWRGSSSRPVRAPTSSAGILWAASITRQTSSDANSAPMKPNATKEAPWRQGGTVHVRACVCTNQGPELASLRCYLALVEHIPHRRVLKQRVPWIGGGCATGSETQGARRGGGWGMAMINIRATAIRPRQ